MTPDEMDAEAEKADEAALVCSFAKDKDYFLKRAAEWREKARRARGGSAPEPRRSAAPSSQS